MMITYLMIQDEEHIVYGCPHYIRGAKMLCPQCNQFFTCRLCHDAISSHQMNRYQVKYMACMYCLRIQVHCMMIPFMSRKQQKIVNIVIKNQENIIVIFVTSGKIQNHLALYFLHFPLILISIVLIVIFVGMAKGQAWILIIVQSVIFV